MQLQTCDSNAKSAPKPFPLYPPQSSNFPHSSDQLPPQASNNKSPILLRLRRHPPSSKSIYSSSQPGPSIAFPLPSPFKSNHVSTPQSPKTSILIPKQSNPMVSTDSIFIPPEGERLRSTSTDFENSPRQAPPIRPLETPKVSLLRLKVRRSTAPSSTMHASSGHPSTSQRLGLTELHAAEGYECLVCLKRSPAAALVACATCPAAQHLHCHNPPMMQRPTYSWRCASCLRAARRRNHPVSLAARSVGTQTEDRASLYIEDPDRSWVPPKLRNKPRLASMLPGKPHHRLLPLPENPKVPDPITLSNGAVVSLRYAVDFHNALVDIDDREDDDAPPLMFNPTLNSAGNDALRRPCELCYTPQFRTYGSGRFCSSRCARTAAGLARRKVPREPLDENAMISSSHNIALMGRRGRGRNRGRGRSRGRVGRGRGRGRGRDVSMDCIDVSDEADDLHGSIMHRSRYGRLVRGRVTRDDGTDEGMIDEERDAEGDDECEDNEISHAKDSGNTSDSASGERMIDFLSTKVYGDLEENRNMEDRYVSGPPVTSYDAGDLPEDNDSIYVGPDGIVEHCMVRKSNRQRKRPASLLLDDDAGDQAPYSRRGETMQSSGNEDSFIPGKRIRLVSKSNRDEMVAVVRSQKGDSNNIVSTSGVRKRKSRKSNGVKPKEVAKPGKGYKFCHHCGQLIANRRFSCTRCGTENPSARRTSRLSNDTHPNNENGINDSKPLIDGKSKLKVRLMMAKSDAQAQNSWQSFGWLDDDDVHLLQSVGYKSLEDLLARPPREARLNEGGEREERCRLLYERVIADRKERSDLMLGSSSRDEDDEDEDEDEDDEDVMDRDKDKDIDDEEGGDEELGIREEGVRLKLVVGGKV